MYILDIDDEKNISVKIKLHLQFEGDITDKTDDVYNAAKEIYYEHRRIIEVTVKEHIIEYEIYEKVWL